MLVEVEPAEWLGTDARIFSSIPHESNGHDLLTGGKHLVFNAGDGEGFRLYMRPMDGLEAEPIPGTEGAVGPFLSPDGEWIGFWANGQLKKVPIGGGPPITLCDAPNPPFGATWGPNQTIVFGQQSGSILEVSANGGEPHAITHLREGEYSHRLPHTLADGETLLFTALRQLETWDEACIVAQSLKTGERKLLIVNGADARYSPTGHLVFARLGTLMAVPIDLRRLEVTGGPVGVADLKQAVNARHGDDGTGAGQFSFSTSGSLAYVTGGIFLNPEKSLIWVDRDGAAEVLPAPRTDYYGPRLSPDGQRIAVSVRTFLKQDIWLYDISRGTSTRLTTEKGSDLWPVWTPDGRRVTFRSDRDGEPNLYWIPADGSGSVERLTTVGPAAPTSWSPNGQVLAFLHRVGEGNNDIWILPLGGEPQPFIHSRLMKYIQRFHPMAGGWPMCLTSQAATRFTSHPFRIPGPRSRSLPTAAASRAGRQTAGSSSTGHGRTARDCVRRQSWTSQRIRPSRPEGRRYSTRGEL